MTAVALDDGIPVIPSAARDRCCVDANGRPFDLSRPVLIAVTALLAVMIVLPMGWLIAYSLSDKQGAATLGNFVTLFTDPSFVDPLITTLIIAVSVSTICCIVAAPLGLAGGAHRHADPPHRAHAGDGEPGHAALRRRHRLGDAGRTQFRAC